MSPADIKPLFDEYVATVMTEGAEALVSVLNFVEWDDESSILFNHDE